MTLTRNLSAMVLTLLCIFALSAVATAGTITFTATLTGAQEVPPRASNGTGTATVVLDDVTGKGTLTVSFSGLTSAVTGGHIHCCVPPGQNAGIIVPFDASLTLSADKTSGSLSNYAFTLTAAQIDAMKNGLTYVNIHTTTFGPGEIRGQLTAVPEPGTLLLFGAGVAAMASRLRKRRSQDE